MPRLQCEKLFFLTTPRSGSTPEACGGRHGWGKAAGAAGWGLTGTPLRAMGRQMEREVRAAARARRRR